jgi:ribonuclease HI
MGCGRSEGLVAERMPREEMLAYLHHALQSLARPYPDQIELYGDSEGITELLGDQWDDGLLYFAMAGEENAAARGLLDQIEQKLEHMPDWSNSALRDSLAWDEIRALARRALPLFGWN